MRYKIFFILALFSILCMSNSCEKSNRHTKVDTAPSLQPSLGKVLRLFLTNILALNTDVESAKAV